MDSVFSVSHLREFTRSVLEKAGTSTGHAAIVADSLTTSNLLGHDSHGVMLLPRYVQRIRDGVLLATANPEVARETGATAVINGHRTFGQVTARFGTDVAVRLARAHGMAAVALQEAMHVGRLGEYAERISAQGFVGLALAAGADRGGAVAPFGGRSRIFGTNPLAWSVPVADSQPPLTSDFSTAAVPAGKVAVARARREPLAPGLLVDRHGNPTTDPAAFYDGGALLPFGGYKGSSLMLLIELLAAILGGNAPASSVDYKPGNPTLLFALSVEAFVPRETWLRQVEELRRNVAACPPADGIDRVRLPHELELETAARRRAGIPVPAAVVASLGELARSLGLAPL